MTDIPTILHIAGRRLPWPAFVMRLAPLCPLAFCYPLNLAHGVTALVFVGFMHAIACPPKDQPYHVALKALTIQRLLAFSVIVVSFCWVAAGVPTMVRAVLGGATWLLLLWVADLQLHRSRRS